MNEQLPGALVNLLERLELADAARVARVERRARRLARGLPLFESVWIDALVQDGVLTLYQARDLRAGRGEQLAVGPFTIVERVSALGSTIVYRALQRATRRHARLAVGTAPIADPHLAARLRELVERSQRVDSRQLAPIRHAEIVGQRLVAACDWIEGATAADRLVRRGRFAPREVVTIARQMTAALGDLEIAGLAHGDITAANLTLSGERAVLTMPGLRGATRPAEGYAAADLAPEDCVALAPERLATATAPGTTSDIYSCGALWWQLLAGRSPFPVANSLATLRAIAHGRAPAVREVVSDAPVALGALVDACLSPDPDQRPDLADLEQRLQDISDDRELRRARRTPKTASSRRRGYSPRAARAQKRLALGAATAMAIVVAAIAWWKTPSTPGPPAIARVAAARPLQAPAVTPPSRNIQATYIAPAEAPTADLVLPHDRPLHIRSLAPRDNQIVRGRRGVRPQVWLRQPIALAADNVRFTDIDFVLALAPGADGPSFAFDLLARRATFEGCSFQAVTANAAPTLVVARTSISASQLPTTTVSFVDCVFARLGGAIELARPGALVASFENSLAVGCGPLATVSLARASDEPLLVTFERSTARECAALLAFSQTPRYGQATLALNSSVLAMNPAGGVVLLSANELPTGVRLPIEVKASGAMLDGHSALVGAARDQALTDELIEVDGLARGEIGFAGEASAGPLASAVTRWTAPLTSTDAPGADVTRLSLPELRR